jgi:DNA-binding transcriptional MerR regulator
LDGLVTIGEFSKMTYLSVKTLRYYHQVGLLEPAEVESTSAYRLYSTAQVSTAQAIRRFRELDMPIETVRAVLHAPDVASRNAVIIAHLQRMQQQLERTQATIASLQSLLSLGNVPSGGNVEYRSIGVVSSVAIRGMVGFDSAEGWCTAAFAEIHSTLEGAGLGVSGPDGALYFDELFQAGVGQIVAFVPVQGPGPMPVPGPILGLGSVPGPGPTLGPGPGLGPLGGSGRIEPFEVPAGDFAVMRHEGPFADLDRTYGALGTVVAERGIGLSGPIREHYPSEATEVCWPVTPPGVPD